RGPQVVNDVSGHFYAGLAQIGALSVSSGTGGSRAVVRAVATFCVDTIADVCLIYKRNIGPHPAAFAGIEAFAELATATHDDLFTERARALGVAELLEEQLTIAGRPVGTLIIGLEKNSPRTISPQMMTLIGSMLSLA